MERFKALFDHADLIPFLLTTGAPKLSIARLLETLIIAAIAGGMAVWATTLVLENDIKHIKASQDRAEEWYFNLETKLDTLEREVYKHKHE